MRNSDMETRDEEQSLARATEGDKLTAWKSLATLWRFVFWDFPFHETGLDYDEYWAEAGKGEPGPARLARFRAIAAHIEPGSSVLDIGCGDGELLAHLRETKGVTAHGLEFSAAGRARAQEKGLDVQPCDLTSPDFSVEREVDYIVISEVLEHVPNPEEVLLKVRDRFRKRLIITIPNVGSIIDRLRLVFGRFAHQWVFHPSEHLRFWTITDFCFTCRQLGYTVERFDGLYTPYLPSFLKLWAWYPRLFAPHVLYVLAWSEEGTAYSFSNP